MTLEQLHVIQKHKQNQLPMQLLKLPAVNFYNWLVENNIIYLIVTL